LASIQQSVEPVPRASEHYQKALDIDPAYARAKLGLGVAQYLTALGDPEQLTAAAIDRELLLEAVDTYEEARRLGLEQGVDLVDSRVRFGLAQIYFLWGLIEDPAWLDRAQDELEWVRDEYLAGRTELSGRAGHAYALLGRIAAVRGDFDTAVKSFREATKLATPFYQSLYYTILGKEYCKAGQTDEAIETYEEAIDLARLYGYPKRVEAYTEILRALRTDGCP
jgi:tetratricopeptide (TPR) repeat protein